MILYRIAAVILLLALQPASAEFEVLTPDNAAGLQEIGVLGTGLIRDAAWSPDGRTVAIASTTRVTLYDSEGWDRVPYHRLPLPAERPWGWAAAYNPDGRLLATLSSAVFESFNDPEGLSRTVEIWDVATEQVLASWTAVARRAGLVFSPDGSMLALDEVWEDNTGLWDIRDLNAVQPMAQTSWDDTRRGWYGLDPDDLTPSENYGSINFSPDGTLAATIHDDSFSIRVWNIESGQEVATIPYGYSSVPLVFSPDNRLLMGEIAQEGYAEVHIWDINRGEEVFYDTTTGTLAFSPDGSTLLMSNAALNVELYDTNTWTRETVMGYTPDEGNWLRSDVVRTLAFSPDGTLAVARANMIEVYSVPDSLRTATALLDTHGPIINLVYSPDGRLLAVRTETHTLMLLDADTLATRATVQHDGTVFALAFSPDSSLLVTTSGSGAYDVPVAAFFDVSDILQSGEATFVDARSRIDYSSTHPTVRFAFSPDGRWLAISGQQGVELWDVEAILEHEMIRERDPQPGTLIDIFDGISPLEFSTDGTVLAVTNPLTPDCRVALWDASRHIRRCIKDQAEYVTDLAFSPDGGLLAVSNQVYNPDEPNTIRLWNPRNGKLVMVLDNHFAYIHTVVFSPDGCFLASAHGGHNDQGWNSDGVVHVWGVPGS